MLIHCPACNTEYDCEPGKYECECGAKFSVTADGNLSVENSVKPSGQTVDLDLDKTIPPQRERVEPDAGATIPGRRDRKPDGRFEVGDLILGRYKVLSELGQGGMGVVYKCLDETAGVVIALKAIPPELSRNTIEMEDVKDNFQLVSKLVHQNIAISKNLEKDNTTGNYYLIMECVEGEDLRRWIKRKRRENTLTMESFLPVIRQVAAALDYAHDEKIIHRDIKPGNIMIDAEGHVKVLDFGLAAQIHTSLTRVSMAYHGTSGTAPYMAPEQWRGRAQGAAADQYALAVMTYEVLAGYLPFDSADVSVLREAVLNETAEPIQGIPGYVQQALARAMSKNPADRFSSCADFAAALAGEQATTTVKNKIEGTIGAVNIVSPVERKTDNETTIKRVHVLMEQQEWDKSREYCERLLDSDPENPELYLLLCLIEHKVTNESLLLNCKCDLSEDKHFSTAIKFASAERKQQLIDIQSELQESMHQEYEFFINKCLEQNNISDISMLSKCKNPLTENIYFKIAFDCAPTEQKKILFQLQEEQIKNTSAIKKFLRITKKGRVLGVILAIVLIPLLGVSVGISLDERIDRPKDIRDLLLAGLMFCIPMGLFLGTIMAVVWEKYYRPKSKGIAVLWGIISGTVFGQVILILLIYVFCNVFDPYVSFSRVIQEKTSILGGMVFEIPFGIIWSIISFRRFNGGKKKEHQKIQDLQKEYTLWEHKKNYSFSRDNEIELEEIEKRKKDEEIQIANRKQLKKVVVAILVTIVLFVITVFVVLFLCRENEFQKGMSAYEAKDYATAAIHFRNAQDLGYTLNAEKQTFLGMSYYFGTGVEKDYSKAIYLFWRNAQNNYSVAQYYLGMCCYYGLGCVQNTEQAIWWLYQAAEKDVPVAKLELGKIYYGLKDEDNLAKERDYLLPYKPSRNRIYTTMSQSECVEEILSEAVDWFRKAAEQGLAEAQFYLGKCYENGEGVEQNLTAATKWYRNAAEQGNADAQFFLGKCYEKGWGVGKNHNEAVKWVSKAAEQGHEDADNYLKQLLSGASMQNEQNNKSFSVSLPDGSSIPMVKTDAGTFVMSEKDMKNEEDELLLAPSTEVPHKVTLTRDFYIGQTEVTQKQWSAVMGTNPSEFKGDALPVESVSWNDAMAFCEKLNAMGKAPNGWKFTLPTETQWEYAARGGKKTKGYKYSGSNSADEVAWYNQNSNEETHPVGQKKANELGIYDMSGNVMEWCLDEYTKEKHLYKPGIMLRILRGGGAKNNDCSLTYRSGMIDSTSGGFIGFRLALVKIK